MPTPKLDMLELPFPFKGYHEVSGVAEQPEGTTGATLNARGYDLAAGRDRGCQRAGLSKWVATRKQSSRVEVMATAATATPDAGGGGGGGLSGAAYSKFLAAVPDGFYSEGVAVTAGSLYDETWKYATGSSAWYQVLSGVGVDPGPQSAGFATGPVLFGTQVVFVGTVTNRSRVEGTISSTKLGIYGDHPYFSVRTNPALNTIIVDVNNADSVYSHSYSVPGYDTASHIITIILTLTNVTVFTDNASPWSHNFTAQELADLAVVWDAGGGCASMQIDGPGGWTYNDIAINSNGVATIDYALSGEKVLYGQNGTLYLGNKNGFSACSQGTLTPTPAYTTGNEISVTAAYGYFYIVDGTNALRRIAITDGTITQPAATGGSLPTGSRLTWVYRGRLFLGRSTAEPFNYFASKSGDPLNFDYSDRTPVGAFAGNDTPQAGLLGDVLTAAIPYGDVSCVIGMANSVALMRGDPKAGGSIDTLSREVGIVRPSAWARDPEQNAYFMARTGLYMLNGQALRTGASASVQPLSRGRLNTLLGQIDHNTYKVTMSWDPQEQGLKIYLVPNTNTLPTTAIFWGQRQDDFWIDSYAANAGPTACQHINDVAGGRPTVLLGCWDGYLRAVDPTALTDDGESFASFVEYTPVQFMGPMINAKIIGQRNQWGVPTDATSFNIQYQWRLGDDASTARVATLIPGGTVTTGGYQSLDRTRLRGACAILRIGTSVPGKTWSVEKITILTAPSGRVRT